MKRFIAMLLLLASSPASFAQQIGSSGAPTNVPNAIRRGTTSIQVLPDGSIQVRVAGSLRYTIDTSGNIVLAQDNLFNLGSGSFRFAGAWFGGTVAANLFSGSGANLTNLSNSAVLTAIGFTPVNPANNLSDLASAATARMNLGLGSFALKNSLIANDIPSTLNATTAPSFLFNGTGGAGYAEFVAQSSNPSAPSGGFRLFADSLGRLTWRRASDTFTRTFDATLTANHIFTLPDADTKFPIFSQVLTFIGPTAARTVTLPDANFTVARTDAGQTFTGTQVFPAIDAPLISPTGSALEQRNGANAQTFRFYASYTDASNYTRGALSASTSAVTLAAESAGTGSANVGITLIPKGTGNTNLSSGALQLNGTTVIDSNRFAAFGAGSIQSWSSNWRAVHIGYAGSLAAGNSSAGVLTDVVSNAYNDGSNWIRIAGGVYASHYQQIDGSHNFYVAGTGPAGGTITFTNAFMINNNGSLSSSTGASLTSGGTWTNAPSWGYLKKDVTPVTRGESVSLLSWFRDYYRPVRYRYKAGDDGFHFGFLLDDMPRPVRDLVTAGNPSGGISTKDSEGLLFALTKELARQVEEQRVEIESLKREMNRLKRRRG